MFLYLSFLSAKRTVYTNPTHLPEIGEYEIMHVCMGYYCLLDTVSFIWHQK